MTTEERKQFWEIVENGDNPKGTANTVGYAIEFNKKVVVIT